MGNDIKYMSDIGEILAESGIDVKMEKIKPGESLQKYGLTSLKMVEVALRIEDKYGREIDPDHITQKRFGTIRAINNTISELLGEG